MRLVNYIIIIILVVAGYLLLPFLTTVFTSLLLAFLSIPFYSKLKKLLRSRSLTALTLTLSSLSLFGFLAYLLIRMIIVSFIQLQQVLDANVVFLNNLIAGPEGYLLRSDPSNLVSFIENLFLTTPKVLLDLLLIGFLLFYLIRESDKIKIFITNSLSKKNTDKFEFFLKRTDYILENILWEYFFVGGLIGVIVLVSFLFLGINYPLELATIAFVISIFPVISGWMLTLVLSFYYHFTARFFNTFILFIITVPLFFISYYSHKVFKVENGINPLMMVLGLVSGVLSMGLFGFIAGPVLAGVIQASYETIMKH